MTATLLVTGGGGFVLSHLVRQWLEADPAARAIVIDTSPMDAAATRWVSGVAARLDYRQGSVIDPAIWARLPKAEITHIAHAAAVTSINRLMENGIAGGVGALETNVMGTVYALAFAQTCPNLQRMIQVSTGSVYGTNGPEDPALPLPEEGYIDPDGYYGITKYAGEQLALQAARQQGLPIIAIRLSSIYGPMDRETPHRAVMVPPGRILRAGLAGRLITVSSLEGAYDVLHAGDAARAMRALFAAQTLNHAVYNVARGVRDRMENLLSTASAVLPALAYALVPREEADITVAKDQTEGRWNAYDISRVTQDTGWRPMPLIDAFEDYKIWLEETGI